MVKLNIDQLPTRLSAVFFAEVFCNFVKKARTSFDMDNDEIIITCFVVSQNMRNILNNRDEAKNFGYEENALPESDRVAVSVKDIVLNLNIPRETVRRKLVSLTEKNILLKVSNGYIFPRQVGETDFTSELRNLIVGSFYQFLEQIFKVNKIK